MRVPSGDGTAPSTEAVEPGHRRPGSTASAPLAPALAVVALALAALVEHLRLARDVASTITNEDSTLLWYAAREWGALEPRAPNYYGQTYGSTLEAIPAEILRRVGFELGTAMPAVLALVAVVGWLLLAGAAWCRGRYVLAVLAAAAPALLSAYHSFFLTTVPDAPAARLLTVAGAAALLLPSERLGVRAAGWSLLGLGLVLDPSSALLGLPVAAFTLLADGSPRRRARELAIGAALPAAYLLWWWSFYRQHPDHNIHGELSVRPGWSTLTGSLGDLDRFFGLYTLELAPSWRVAVAAVLVLTALLLATRSVRHALPALPVLGLLLWGMASPRAQEVDLGDFFPKGRIFLTLPYALWFLGLLLAEARPTPEGRGAGRAGRAGTHRAAVLGICAVAVTSIGARQLDYDGRVVALRDRGLAATALGYGFSSTGLVRDRCEQVRLTAAEAGGSLVVFVGDRTLAWGCAAIDHGELDTLELVYERRTWRLYEELERTRSGAVLWGVDTGFCRRAQAALERCELATTLEGGTEAVVIGFEEQPALGVIRRLGLPLRDFGPDCEPEQDPTVVAVRCDRPLAIPT